MKIYKSILKNWAALLLALVTVSSCNDVMDTKPFTSYDDDLVWGSKTTADAFINGTIANVMGGYTNANPSGSFGVDIRMQWEKRTNNVSGGEGTFVRDEIDRFSTLGGFGAFDNIRRCNLIIEKAAEYSGKGLSGDESKELIAKGKLLRALLYYQQARTMGRFVWVDRVLTPADTANAGLAMSTTKSTTESYGYMISDMQAAIPDLPETAPGGALNKNMALAFLSEIALQGAAYEPDAAKRKEWLNVAISAANSIQNGTLTPEYGNMFNEKGPNSAEILFAIYRNKANTTCLDAVHMMYGVPYINNDVLTQYGNGPLFKTGGGTPFQGWSGEYAPTQNLVDMYDVIDASTGQGVKWSETTQFKNNVAISEAVPDWVLETETGDVLYSGVATSADADVSALMYENRDARFYESIVYDNCIWWGEEIRMTVKGNLWRRAGGALGFPTALNNYFPRKGIYAVTPRVEYNVPTDYHFVVMRYARALLNKAEAILWLAGMGEGNYADAVALCNQTRTVHGKLPAATVSSLEDAWKLYMKERRVEFCFENDLYWSLLRWGKHGGYANAGAAPGGKIVELTVPPMYIEITHDRKAFYVGKVTAYNAHLRNFREDRRYLLPIPQGQIERNPNLGPNNPGW